MDWSTYRRNKSEENDKALQEVNVNSLSICNLFLYIHTHPPCSISYHSQSLKAFQRKEIKAINSNCSSSLSMAAISALLATWFTPSSLFIVVNIVIGTIAVTSRLASSSNNNKQNHHSPPQLLRSPSLLQRARSFRLSYYYNDSTDVPLSETGVTECTHPQLVRTPSLLERLRSFNLGLHKHEPSQVAETEYEEAQAHEPESEEPKEPKLGRAPSLLQRLQSINLSRIYRSETVHVDEESEPEPEHEGPDPKAGVNVAAEMMRKSASERAREVRSEWEEDGERVEKRRPESARGETAWKREDEEVDAKADDFINRFKKQLRLQRVDSLLRYREMLRGN